MTLRVEVCGVDEIAAALNEAVDDLLRLFDAGAPAEAFAEGHRAEAERTHTKPRTAEGYIVIEGHGALQVGNMVQHRLRKAVNPASLRHHAIR